MKISVIIPTYNRYELLKRAIQSILNQTYSVDEIMVIDDGSTDNTKDIQKDFPEIIYIYQENQGVSCARNIGIQRAKNEWIAFLDSDDEWHQEKLQKQVAFHQNNPDILMSYTAEKWVRGGKVVKIPKKYRKIGIDAFVENLSYCNIAPSSVMMHKKLFEKFGLFDESLRICEDYDMWLRISSEEKIGLISEKLINKYAGHDEQLGFSKDMDRLRVQILENLLRVCSRDPLKQQIQEELFKKCTLLHKASCKYDKIADIQFYAKKLEQYKR